MTFARLIRVKSLGSARRFPYNALEHRRLRQGGEAVYDIISIVFVLGFFALCLLYVQACDRILGPDEELATPAAPGEPTRPANEAIAA